MTVERGARKEERCGDVLNALVRCDQGLQNIALALRKLKGSGEGIEALIVPQGRIPADASDFHAALGRLLPIILERDLVLFDALSIRPDTSTRYGSGPSAAPARATAGINPGRIRPA